MSRPIDLYHSLHLFRLTFRTCIGRRPKRAMPATSSVLRTVIGVAITTLLWIIRSTFSATWWFVTSDSRAAAWLHTLVLTAVAHVLWNKFVETQNANDGTRLKQLLTIDSMRNAVTNLLDKSTDLIEWCIKHGIIRGKLAAEWIDRENKKRVAELLERVDAGDGNAATFSANGFSTASAVCRGTTTRLTDSTRRRRIKAAFGALMCAALALFTAWASSVIQRTE